MYKRFLETQVTEALSDTPAILIVGARQTGKSTFCRQLIDQKAFNGRMVTMDDPSNFEAAKDDPMGYLKRLGRHFIIDEVQRVPELFLSIKKMIDDDRKGTRIILTGSADVMTLPKVADSLAGRIEMNHLWPLSQDELLGKRSRFLETLTSKATRFVNERCDPVRMAAKLQTGGYPEALARRSDERQIKWFASYLTAILQKDISELSRIEGISQIPNILHLLATRVGSTINLADVARLSKVKHTTLQRYMTLLEQVFLIVSLPAWTPNQEGRFVKSPKIMLNDTGLLRYLSGEEVDPVANRTHLGAILENFVVMEVIKQLSWHRELLTPYHFSIHQGQEVDLVLVSRSRKLYGIEVKNNASVKSSDFNGLRKLAELAGDRFEKGIVLYMGEEFLGGFGRGDLFAVPMSNLWKA
jgi:predicted AAA+ superfamily ATPase